MIVWINADVRCRQDEHSNRGSKSHAAGAGMRPKAVGIVSSRRLAPEIFPGGVIEPRWCSNRLFVRARRDPPRGIGDKWRAGCLCCQLLVVGRAGPGQISSGYRGPIGVRDSCGGDVALPAPGTAVHPQGASGRLGDDRRLPTSHAGHGNRVQESHHATSSQCSQSQQFL